VGGIFPGRYLPLPCLTFERRASPSQ